MSIDLSTRAGFERAARDQNARRDAEVVANRASGAPCKVIDMLAFGGTPYCTTHRVMGRCPFAASATTLPRETPDDFDTGAF